MGALLTDLSYYYMNGQCYRLLAVFGLAEELIVNDDPEFQVYLPTNRLAASTLTPLPQWIDRLRPTRASNQARQNVFTSLTGQLQRQLGVKARERGGNAVLGYRQSFDLEGETGPLACAWYYKHCAMMPSRACGARPGNHCSAPVPRSCQHCQ